LLLRRLLLLLLCLLLLLLRLWLLLTLRRSLRDHARDPAPRWSDAVCWLFLFIPLDLRQDYVGGMWLGRGSDMAYDWWCALLLLLVLVMVVVLLVLVLLLLMLLLVFVLLLLVLLLRCISDTPRRRAATSTLLMLLGFGALRRFPYLGCRLVPRLADWGWALFALGGILATTLPIGFATGFVKWAPKDLAPAGLPLLAGARLAVLLSCHHAHDDAAAAAHARFSLVRSLRRDFHDRGAYRRAVLPRRPGARSALVAVLLLNLVVLSLTDCPSLAPL